MVRIWSCTKEFGNSLTTLTTWRNDDDGGHPINTLLKIPRGQVITKLCLIFFTNHNTEPHFEEDSTTQGGLIVFGGMWMAWRYVWT